MVSGLKVVMSGYTGSKSYEKNIHVDLSHGLQNMFGHVSRFGTKAAHDYLAGESTSYSNAAIHYRNDN